MLACPSRALHAERPLLLSLLRLLLLLVADHKRTIHRAFWFWSRTHRHGLLQWVVSSASTWSSATRCADTGPCVVTYTRAHNGRIMDVFFVCYSSQYYYWSGTGTITGTNTGTGTALPPYYLSLRSYVLRITCSQTSRCSLFIPTTTESRLSDSVEQLFWGLRVVGWPARLPT